MRKQLADYFIKEENFPALMKYEGDSEVVTIPEEIETLNSGIFKDLLKLRKVILSKGIKEIDSASFENCPNLEEIVFSEDCYIRTDRYDPKEGILVKSDFVISCIL